MRVPANGATVGPDGRLDVGACPIPMGGDTNPHEQARQAAERADEAAERAFDAATRATRLLEELRMVLRDLRRRTRKTGSGWRADE